MITVNIHEAKTHLSRLLKRVSVGEDKSPTAAEPEAGGGAGAGGGR